MLNVIDDDTDYDYEAGICYDGDYTMKCILLGDSGVGKSCLSSRFAVNGFAETFVSTIGADFMKRTINLDGKIIRVYIFDTSGQERFCCVISSVCLRGANAVMLVFDVTQRESFTNLPKWLEQVNRFSSETAVKLLVGNKCDLTDDREVEYTEAKEFAESIGMAYMETSAKDTTNVELTFITLISDYKNNVLEVPSKTGLVKVCSSTHEDDEKRKRCC